MTATGKEERVVNFDQAADIIKNWKTSDLRLPSDFDWSTRKEGQTLSGAGSFPVLMPFLDLAIKTGYPLPDDHTLWSQRIERFEGGWFTVAHYAVQRGNTFEFPFSHWALKDSDGQPVIHALIRSRMTPPAHFSQWEIKNTRGLSAAHAYLYSLQKPFPEGFTAWTIRDELGWTTAHVAMKLAADTGKHEIARLPEDRALWLLEKNLERPAPEGTRAGTVLHAAAGRGLPVPDIFSIEDFHLKNEHGYSVIDLARKGMNLRLVAQYEALVLAAQLADRPAIVRISRRAP